MSKAVIAILVSLLLATAAYAKCTPTCSSKQEVDNSVPFTCLEWGYNSDDDCGAAPAEDWSASFTAIWNLDEASGTRVASGGSCSSGSDCDLTDNNTVTNDSTNKKEGTAAASFANANTEYLSCADGTCNELDYTGDMSAGCWGRPTLDTVDLQLFIKLTAGAGATADGYNFHFEDFNDTIRCRVKENGTQYDALGTGGAWAQNTFAHAVCTWADSATTLQPYLNGATTGTANTAAGLGGDSTADFAVGGNGVSTFDGQLDECFIIGKTLTAQQVCRICSCQIDGSLCTCNGTTYTDAGRNVADCGSCTLPDCDSAAP